MFERERISGARHRSGPTPGDERSQLRGPVIELFREQAKTAGGSEKSIPGDQFGLRRFTTLLEMVSAKIAYLDQITWVNEIRAMFLEFEAYGAERHRTVLEATPVSFGKERGLGGCALYALLARGIEGVEAIYKIALGSSELNFVAQRALIRVAVADPSSIRCMSDTDSLVLASTAHVVSKAEKVLCAPIIQQHAKNLTRKLVQNLLGDPGSRLSVPYLWLMTDEMDRRSEAEILLSDIIGRSILRVSDQICDELQELISQDRPESVYQKFLEQHPAILDPLASSVIPGKVLGEMYKRTLSFGSWMMGTYSLKLRSLRTHYSQIILSQPKSFLMLLLKS